MICSHNPNTWKLHPDIKSSSIPTSASSLPGHDYIRVSHLSYNYYIFLYVVHRLSMSFEPGIWTRKTTPRSTPGPDPVVVVWEEFTSIAINESHWKEPRVKWWAEWLAGRSIGPTLQDVNISFNHESLYYSMNRGGGGSSYQGVSW